MGKLIKKFFWVCSGATVPLLEPCETEHNKYVGIGATVLITGVLAGISAGYALYTVFWSLKWSVAFGMLWGLMIFNLDRFIILSIKKEEPDPARGWARKTKDKLIEISALLPRLALAVLLAFIITRPLELKLFEKEVEKEMEAMKREEEAELQASMNPSDGAQQQQQAGSASQIAPLKKEVEFLRQKIEDKKKQWQTAQDEANCECLGTCGTGRYGVGPNCERERDEADVLKADYLRAANPNSEINAQINATLKSISDLENVRAALTGQARQTREKANGLATRLSAFDRLTSSDEVYGRANLALMLIFILLETAPILAKLFLPYGPYDRLLETSELRTSLTQMKEQMTLVDDALRMQQSSERHRQAMLSMQDRMLDEIESQAGISREFSGQVQAEWNQAKHEFVRRAISELRKHERRPTGNGSH